MKHVMKHVMKRVMKHAVKHIMNRPQQRQHNRQGRGQGPRPATRFGLRVALVAVVVGLAAGALLSAVVAPMGVARAGAIVIRDSRATDTSVTPVLGRGYSLATNTYLSACFSAAKPAPDGGSGLSTKESYDFRFRFVQGDVSSEAADTATDRVFGADDEFVRDTVEENQTRARARGNIARSVVVKLDIETYYSSVDESRAKLSESASDLLKRGDLPGFFASCGSTFVRGIARIATYVGVLTYEAETAAARPEEMSPRDRAFEAALFAAIQGMTLPLADVEAAETKAAREKAGTTVEKPRPAEADESAERRSFYRQMADRNLTIALRGWGLGKRENTALIATSIPDFKKALATAYQSMQLAQTGRVTSIEVVPWSDNVNFQAMLDLHGVDNVKGREISIGEKKELLSYNAEFLAKVNSEARSRMNAYYLAKVCDQNIKRTFYVAAGLDPEQANLPLRNHKTMRPGITLQQLDAALGDGKVAQAAYEDYKQFMYEGQVNVSSCLDELMRDPAPATAPAAAAQQPAPAAAKGSQPRPASVSKGMFLNRFSDLPACVGLEGAVGSGLPEDVEQHCLPIIWDGARPAAAGGET